jgi:hypothetical protein
VISGSFFAKQKAKNINPIINNKQNKNNTKTDKSIKMYTGIINIQKVMTEYGTQLLM